LSLVDQGALLTSANYASVYDLPSPATAGIALHNRRFVMTNASPTPEEVALLARHAGLDLPPEYFQQLVSAYSHVRPVIGRLPLACSRGDEPAHAFDPRAFMP
jgi:hypothetical protein